MAMKKLLTRTVSRDDSDFPHALVAYLRTKSGRAMTMYLMGQLIDQIVLDHKGRATDVQFTTERALVLDVVEEVVEQ